MAKPARHAPEQRWITVADAVGRVPLADARARRLLRTRGLVRAITDTDPETGTHTVEVVWLPDLAQLADELQAERQAGRVAAASTLAPTTLPMPAPKARR